MLLLTKEMKLQTTLYTEDWIGLKALDDAGRVKFISVQGNHLRISEDDIKKYIVPFLVDDKPPKLLHQKSSVDTGLLAFTMDPWK